MLKNPIEQPSFFSSLIEHQGILIICSLMTTLLIVFASYFIGKQVGLNDSKSLFINVKQNKMLEAELTKTKSRLTMMETTHKVNNDALAQVRETILLLEQQIYDQQKEIITYQSIISNNKQTNVLEFRDFIIQATEQPHTYRYKLFLTRRDQPKTLLEGTLQINIVGIEEDKPKSLSLPELTDSLDYMMGFSFRYMAMIPDATKFAEMTLPDKFTPQKIVITVHFSTPNIPPETKELGWSVHPLPIKDPLTDEE